MRKLREYIIYGVVCVLFLTAVSIIEASELVWIPINPSFGGYAGNASWLMNAAQVQNRHKEETRASVQQDPFEDFEYNLKRQYIYALSSKIIDEAFGEEGLLPEGQTEAHYSIGDFVIDIDGNGQLTVVITDTSTGNMTTVEVPFY